MGGEGAICQNNMDNYNVISIDQRGMGRSSPSFVHKECKYAYNQLQAWTDSGIRDVLDKQKKVARDCWSCDDCGFHLKAKQKDGTTRKFHFLE